MRGGQAPLAWLLLVVWCAWLFAAQGLVAGHSSLGPWVPEAGVMLLVALDGRLAEARWRRAALLVAATRVAFSAEPVLAVFAAYLGVGGLLAGLRRVVEIEHRLVRTVLAGAAAFAVAGWWILCRRIELLEAGLPAPPPVWPWREAVTTSLAVLLALPLLRRLPGLSPLTLGRGRRR